MSTQAMAVRDPASLMERAVIQGDLSELSAAERVDYYKRVCDSLKLNPYTKPFAYLELDAGGGEKKLELYAKRDCTDQLRKIHGVSIPKLEREWTPDLYIVTAHATTPDGRTDSATGAVPIAKEGGKWEDVTNRKGEVQYGENGKPRRRFVGDGSTARISGEALANAIMKAETKAKRRVTLSICGLGLTDESEIDSIPGARVIEADLDAAPVNDEDARRQWRDAYEAWLKLSEKATRLGVVHKSLGEDASAEKIKRWTEALSQRVDVAAYDRMGLSAQDEAPTEAEKTAPRDVATGEVLDTNPPDRWAENRRLTQRAHELHLAGVPTLPSKSTANVVEEANRVLAERIANVELDQKLADEQLGDQERPR